MVSFLHRGFPPVFYCKCMENRPSVGVSVIVFKNGKVLLGKRIGNHGGETWCFPGGHLEHGEHWNDTARREALEETGLTITSVKFGSITNDVFDTGKHYITIHTVATSFSGNLQNCEPEKCEGWEWFDWDALPEHLFLSTKNLVNSGFDPRT